MWRALHKARRKELAQYGITIEEASVLVVVDVIGNKTTPLDISRWILREPHSTSELLGRMEKRGLLKRAKDLKDKRRLRISMTKKGREALRMASKRQSIHHILSASLSTDAEQQQLNTLVEKIWANSLERLGRRKMYEIPLFPLLQRGRHH